MGKDDLLDVQNIVPQLFELSKNSVIISRVYDGQVIAGKGIDVAGMVIPDQKLALFKDRIRYF
jgi:hypothetical protein